MEISKVSRAVELYDENGTPWGLRHADNQARVISKPYLYATAEGDIAGHTGINKPGYNPDVSTAIEDLWFAGGVYVPPAAAMQMSVKSSDNAQDKAGGTGALTVEIHYLDNLYAEQTTAVTLNGTTYVDTTPTNILRVQGFHVASVGTGGYPVGNITIVDKATQTITYGYIALGYNRGFNSFWTVPAGKTLYITEWQVGCASGTSKYGDFLLKVTSMEGVKTTHWFGVDRCLIQDTTMIIEPTYPWKVPATADVKMSVKGSGTIVAAGHWGGWCE